MKASPKAVLSRTANADNEFANGKLADFSINSKCGMQP